MIDYPAKVCYKQNIDGKISVLGVTSLEIVRAHEGDSGTYRCSASNYLGEASDYATLDVTGSEFQSSASKRNVDDFHMSMDRFDARLSLLK